MSTEEFIIGLFCRVDDIMCDVPRHPQAVLYPSEIVTLALLFALKGTGERAFYRWLVGDPPNMKVCHRGEWNDRMAVETVLSMLTVVCHTKQMHHRLWAAFRAHLGWLMALFNILVQWHGLTPDDEGRIRLSIAAFSL